MKFNNNYYGLQTAEKVDQSFSVPVGQVGTTSVKIQIMNAMSEGNAPQKPPILIQVGLFCSLDVFYFEIPVLAQTLF